MKPKVCSYCGQVIPQPEGRLKCRLFISQKVSASCLESQKVEILGQKTVPTPTISNNATP